MIRFTPISEQKYDDWVGRQGKNRYIITLLGRTVTARHIAEVTKVVAQHDLNIDAIKRLTGRCPCARTTARPRPASNSRYAARSRTKTAAPCRRAS